MSNFHRCPQCGTPVQFGTRAEPLEVCCPSCQKTFVVEPIPEVIHLPEQSPAIESRPRIPSSNVEPQPWRPRSIPNEVRAKRLRSDWEQEQKRKEWKILLGVLVLIGLMISGMFWWTSTFTRNLPTHAGRGEDQQQRRQEIVNAFHEPTGEEAEANAIEMQKLFDDLGVALSTHNKAKILDHINIERMFDECMAHHEMPTEITRNRGSILNGFETGLGEALEKRSLIFYWNRSEIRRVKYLGDNVAVIIARHRQPNDADILKIRWWVIREKNRWQAFDMENLDVGCRYSILMSTILAGGGQQINEANRAVGLLNDIMHNLQTGGDIDEVEQRIANLPQIQVPSQIQAMRWLLLGILRSKQGKPAEALAQYEKARELQPDMPFLDMLQGMLCNRLGRWDEAIDYLEAYRNLLGDDANVMEELGLALRGLGRFREAADAYRKALDDNPKNADAFHGLLQSLENGAPRDDLGERFAKLDQPATQFKTLAEECVKDRDGASLEAISLALLNIDPKSSAAAYHLGLAKIWNEQTTEGMAFITEALKHETDREQRAKYLEGFFDAMLSADQLQEAYAAVPDAREAFSVLAPKLNQQYRADQLRQLIKVHAVRYPDEPLLPFIRAALLVKAGRYKQADQAFAQVLDKKPDATMVNQFRADRVTAKYHIGQALAAYADIGPQNDTFKQLIDLSRQNDDYDLLKQLLAVRPSQLSQDNEVVEARISLLVHEQRFTEAADLVKQSKSPANEENRDVLAQKFVLQMATIGKSLEAYRLAPDAKKAFAILASDLDESEQVDSLRQLVEAHRQAFPDDPQLAIHLASFLMQKKEFEQAIKVLHDAMTRAESIDIASLRHHYVEAMYRAGREQQAYLEADPESRDQVFSQLTRLLIADKKRAELETLIAMHRDNTEDTATLLHMEAQVKLLAGEPAEAIPLLQQAYEQAVEPYRKIECLSTLVFGLEAAGQGLEGYRAAPDKVMAFSILARRLLTDKKTDMLEKLLQEHSKSQGTDPLLPIYQGELHLLKGEFDKAGELFTAARTKARKQDKYMIRNGFLRARVGAGKAVSAYRDLGALDSDRSLLIQICFTDKNPDQLRQLLDTFRSEDPEDPNLPIGEVQWNWLRKDYAKALQVLHEKRDELTSSHWPYEDWHVRCLIKLNRMPEALKAAEENATKPHDDIILLVLAHAASGDVQKTIADVEKQRNNSFLVQRCYDDEDLGPLLRSAPFQPFRDRFPEPKQKGSAD